MHGKYILCVPPPRPGPLPDFLKILKNYWTGLLFFSGKSKNWYNVCIYLFYYRKALKFSVTLKESATKNHNNLSGRFFLEKILRYEKKTPFSGPTTRASTPVPLILIVSHLFFQLIISFFCVFAKWFSLLIPLFRGNHQKSS